MKRIILLLVVGYWLFANTNVNAQEIKLGARAGLNLSKMTSELDGLILTTNNVVGFHFGFVANVTIHDDLLYLQPGLLLSTKGGEVNVTDVGSATINMYNLELPLMLSLKVAIVDNLALRVNVGPYFGFGLFGEVDSGGTSQDAFSYDIYKRPDTGFGFGGGLEFKKFYLGINYNLGLANISQHIETGKDKNRTLGITLGYNLW